MQKLIAILVYFAATSAFADIVQSTGSSTQEPSNRFGQSFTAIASEAQIGTVSYMWGGTLNASEPDPLMYAQLRSGSGFGGVLMSATLPAAVPDSTPAFTWIDFTFDAPVTLAAGQPYTLQFAANNAALVSGSYLYSTSDPYSGEPDISPPIRPLHRKI